MRAGILSVVAALALPAVPAAAKRHGDTSPFVILVAESEAPRGYVEMCASNPQWCVQGSRVADKERIPRRGGGEGGSAFPVVLSFNFSVPADALAAAGARVQLEAAGIDVGWTSLLGAVNGASGVIGNGAISAAWENFGTQPGEHAGKEVLALLNSVNRKVNGAVVQRRDAQIYGRGELWRRSGAGRGAVGDCEDIAIEKRLQLIAQGFPAEKLSYAVVYRRDVGLHTVLLARTADRDVVLDSLNPRLRGWSDTDYSWISVQSMEDPSRWYVPARRAAS